MTWYCNKTISLHTNPMSVVYDEGQIAYLASDIKNKFVIESDDETLEATVEDPKEAT